VFASFLESTFLGLYLFGSGRIPRGLHGYSVFMVALGATTSAFWILVANSWQQTPVCRALRNGRAEAHLENLWEAVFNPSTLPEKFAAIEGLYISTQGALFAAFAIVYATVFGGFYLALMLLVAALVFRAASFEFRGKVDNPRWRRFWDGAFTVGSFVPALLYGVAVGNVVRGVPIDAVGGFTGSFLGLLNPYALLTGLVTLTLFTAHGAAFMCLKTDGDHLKRMRRWALGGWAVFAVLYLTVTGWSLGAVPHALDQVTGRPIFWVFVVLVAAGLVFNPQQLAARRFTRAFLGSSVTIVAMIGAVATGLYPRLVPSGTALAHSLTIYNASSTPRTLTVMLVIALIGMPLVLVYTAYVYRVFKGTVVLGADSY
jgi:cytochrome d ubiquinol oxidase subunit II